MHCEGGVVAPLFTQFSRRKIWDNGIGKAANISCLPPPAASLKGQGNCENTRKI